MLTEGYEFYKGTYHGDRIAAAEWPALSRDGAPCLEGAAPGRPAGLLAPGPVGAGRGALCAVAEELHQERQGGEVASATNDGYSETYVTSGRSPAGRRRDAAWLWLGNTGLMYRGVDGCWPVTKP